MDKTYKVQEIMKWWSNFEDNTIKIKSKNKEFIIELNKEQLPNLLGMQYARISKNNKFIKGKELYKYIKNNNLSDQDIYEKILENNEGKEYILKNVQNRINTFVDFMKNLENGYIVEKTDLGSNIKSKELIVQVKNGDYWHLGLKETDKNQELNEYELEGNLKRIFETYIVENSDRYFKGSIIMEEIKEIYILEKDKLIPFSFDDEKNKKLLEEYEREQDDGWDKFGRKDKEMER